jgi:hypothetical protein
LWSVWNTTQVKKESGRGRRLFGIEVGQHRLPQDVGAVHKALGRNPVDFVRQFNRNPESERYGFAYLGGALCNLHGVHFAIRRAIAKKKVYPATALVWIPCGQIASLCLFSKAEIKSHNP